MEINWLAIVMQAIGTDLKWFGAAIAAHPWQTVAVVGAFVVLALLRLVVVPRRRRRRGW
jgi:acyl dehydratase